MSDSKQIIDFTKATGNLYSIIEWFNENNEKHKIDTDDSFISPDIINEILKYCNIKINDIVYETNSVSLEFNLMKKA